MHKKYSPEEHRMEFCPLLENEIDDDGLFCKGNSHVSIPVAINWFIGVDVNCDEWMDDDGGGDVDSGIDSTEPRSL